MLSDHKLTSQDGMFEPIPIGDVNQENHQWKTIRT